MSLNVIIYESGTRTEERIPIVGELFFTHPFSHLKGVTADISKSGACVHTCDKLNRGLNITVESKAFRDVKRIATVRWCKKVDEEIYKVGLSFLQ